MKNFIVLAPLFWSSSICAQTVIDQKTTTYVEVIFHVQEKQDSPMQGRLVYDPATFNAMSAKQLQAAQLAQFAAWKIVRDTPPPVPTKADLIARQAELLAQRDAVQAEADQITAEVAAK